MKKTILITGSTDGIGLLTARMLSDAGHRVILHGRSREKLDAAVTLTGGPATGYVADLSGLAAVEQLADVVRKDHDTVDVLINNAGVYRVPETTSTDGIDMRFMVNTLAPYALTRALLPSIPKTGRIINLSSAAQAPVDVEALSGRRRLGDMDAYAQSKLALTIWSRELASELPDGPVVVAVNPGSLLASKMVKEGFGVVGNDLRIGAEILCRAALSDEFAGANGKYFDNDIGRFAEPNSAAGDAARNGLVMAALKQTLAALRCA